MSVSSFLTAEQKREFVYGYVTQPHGSKGHYLREHGLTCDQMRGWRAQVFAGTLEFGLMPRGGSVVSAEESAALARLIKENQSLREKLQVQQASHEQAVASKDAELAVHLRAVDALGKAIEILHAGAGKNSQQHRAGGEQ